MKLFHALLLLFITGSISAQEKPAIFEPGKISGGGQFGLTISPDCKTSLWVRSNGKRDTLFILESKMVNGKWQTPVIASFSGNTAWKDIDPMFSPDGKTVLFQSNRPVPGKPGRQGFDIWAVRKLVNKWSEPFHLGNTLNTDASESYASATLNGDLYFMKDNEQEPGNSDIFISKLIRGQYQTPINIGSPVNTKARESNPYISSKSDFMIYFSSAEGGYGEVDLMISFLKNGKWSEPKNLGSRINTAAAEFCPFVQETEKKLYFSRQIKQGDRMLEDLYVVDFDVEEYR